MEEGKECKFCKAEMKWTGGGQRGSNSNKSYLSSRCTECGAEFTTEKTWTTKVSRAEEKPVKNRFEEDHLILIKELHEGSVRKYMLSMGEFKDVDI